MSVHSFSRTSDEAVEAAIVAVQTQEAMSERIGT